MKGDQIIFVMGIIILLNAISVKMSDNNEKLDNIYNILIEIREDKNAN